MNGRPLLVRAPTRAVIGPDVASAGTRTTIEVGVALSTGVETPLNATVFSPATGLKP